MAYSKFKPYYPPAIAHVARHFPSSPTSGSKFIGRFKKPEEVTKYAWEKIEHEYQGRLLIRQVEFSESIGLEALIPLKDIPLHVTRKRVNREVTEKGSKRPVTYSIWTTYEMSLQPTKSMTIIAGPWEGNQEIHTFLTIYPGRYAPDFTDKKFWRNHALISTTGHKPRKKH